MWECSPGRWRREVTRAEFCQFLSGRCSFTADTGEVLQIEAGDPIFFPANTTGGWDVTETVRKSYLVFDPAQGPRTAGREPQIASACGDDPAISPTSPGPALAPTERTVRHGLC